ncbi:amylopullulanase [Muribaculaceae bacterium]|nr:amylopullulanase [Muribaculaceae bacterium]
MRYNVSNMTMPSYYVAMNELSNHDHSRFLTRTNRFVGRTNSHGPEAADRNVNKAVMREAVVIQMTWPGSPTIYYGDEAGVTGFTDPDNRRTYPWGG